MGIKNKIGIKRPRERAPLPFCPTCSKIAAADINWLIGITQDGSIGSNFLKTGD
jgi:hypothetical protein